MDFIRQKQIAIKKRLIDAGLYDVRLVGLVLVGFVAVSVFWSGAKIIQQNYELSLKVQQIDRENQIIELENRAKELQNSYLATDTFAELTARRVNGKAAPGERVYIVPENIALSALSTPSKVEETQEITPKPQYQQNLESWLGIYFGN